MKGIISVFAMTVFAALAVAGAASAQEKTLRFADIQPLTHPLSRTGAQYFIDRVNEEGEGLISIQHYPNRQLGQPKEMVDLLSGRAADIAFIGPTWYPGKMPLSTVGDLPGLYADWRAGSRALWRLITETELLNEEFTKWGMRPLVAVLIPSYDLIMNEPIEEVTSLEGRKIRSPGGSYDVAAEVLGGTAVTMPSPETYTALQRGTMDGTFANYLVVDGYKLNELVGFGTYGAPLGSFTFIYAINEDVWQELSPEQQELLARVGKETNEHMNSVLESMNRNLADQFVAEDGIELRVLSEEEKQSLIDLLQPVQEQWVATLEERGHPAKDILQTYKSLLEEESTQ